MREYFITVVMVSLLTAVASLVSPDGKMKKPISFSLSVILVCALLLPLFDALRNLQTDGYNFDFDISENGEILNQSFEEETKNAVNIGIEKAICEKFDIDDGDIEVKTDLKIIGSEVVFLRADVYLSGKGIFSNLPEIKKYINKALGAECEVFLLDQR